MIKRELEVVVISDIHLGTYACHSEELLKYLNSIHTKILVLNGDIIDSSQFQRKLFARDHLEIIEQLRNMAIEGTKVYYLSGNHDDIVRGYSPITDSNIILRNHLEFVIDQKKYWIFHGDIFDSSVTIAPWLARIGLNSYKHLIRINRIFDLLRKRLGAPPFSLAQQIKRRFNRAFNYIHDFENIICKHALKKDYDVVICGHIHVPVIKKMCDGKITYMNSGDWVENLTALEFQHQTWNIYRYDAADYPPISRKLQVPIPEPSKKTISSILTLGSAS